MTVDEIESIQVEPDVHISTAAQEEVILSVFWRRGMLGAASYIVETSEVYLLTDIVDVNPEYNMLKSLYQQVQPSHVVTSGAMSETFISTLRELLVTEDDASEDSSTEQELLTQNHLHFLPKKEYVYDSCKRRIHALKLLSEPEGSDEAEHQLYINSLVATTAESMVHAFGALLKWLDHSWAHLNLDAEVARTSAPILAINSLSLEDIVTIDSETYEALQIFSQQSHPSNFKMWTPGSSKEGLSIFGIFNRCKSRLGCKFMRVMFVHPTRNIDVLNARLDVIGFCMQSKNQEIVKRLLDCLKAIKSITMIMTKLSAAKAMFAEWKTLHKTIYHSIMIGELCRTLATQAPLFQKIAECLSDDLHHVAHCINRIVDFEESELQKKFIVRLGIDEELDRMKVRLSSVPELMNNMAERELVELPPEVQECSMAYIPEIGYLLAIPMWKPQHLNDENYNLPGLDFMFKVGQTVHYKSARCRELDDTVGDAFLLISDQEARIMIKLVQFVQSHLRPLVRIVKLTAELDCLIALASVARENNYVRPTLTHERVLDIKGGWHPLQEMCVDTFVPNDTLSGEKHSLMKILTGPNASGKSVYLKQVALIAYLAHIGSFVPAASAHIGILDHIHTRIQTVESIATRLSAFLIDMRQMSLSLFCSTPSSLIIIDEYGKGTSEVDGLALLASSLKSFLDRGAHCPHVFVSTHFHNLTQILPHSKYLRSQTLEHLVDQDGQIVYLFKLKDGEVKSSFALKVAETVGIPTEVIERATVVLRSLQSGQPMQGLENCKRSLQLAKLMDCYEKITTVTNDSDFVTVQQRLKDA